MFSFSPRFLGEMVQFNLRIFLQMGWFNHQLLLMEEIPFPTTCYLLNPAKKGTFSIWVFPKIGVPQNGWFIMENPIKMDDLGVPLFSETPISTGAGFLPSTVVLISLGFCMPLSLATCTRLTCRLRPLRLPHTRCPGILGG